MKTSFKTIYIANDGTEFYSEEACQDHEYALHQIKNIEYWLGGLQHPEVEANHGFYQHKQQLFTLAWAETIRISRKYFKGFEKLEQAEAREIHPMGVGGRIISESNAPEPIKKLWVRFACIDSEYREWQQPYFALNPGTGTQEMVN